MPAILPAVAQSAATLPLFASPDTVSAVVYAATPLAKTLEQGRGLDSRALRSTMEAAFSSTDAGGCLGPEGGGL